MTVPVFPWENETAERARLPVLAVASFRCSVAAASL